VRTTTVDGRIRLALGDGLARGLFEAPDKAAFAANYLVVDVECTAASDSTIVTSYELPAYWQQPTLVRCSTGAARWRLFLPTYDLQPQIRVGGLEWNAADPIRVRAVRKIQDLAATPLLLKLTLPDHWRGQPLYHEFSLAALETPQPW
jgi:hypothetical protein